MKLLVCNAGSTSLKFRLFEMPQEKTYAVCKIERVGSQSGIFSYENCVTGYKDKQEGVSIPTYTDGIKLFLDELLGENGSLGGIGEIERVGFKTVLAKGFYGIHELTPEVLEGMQEYMVVAPSHNGPYLEAIRQLRALLPEAKFVGAFETAFHMTIPLERRLYGVPYEWYEKYGVQRLGYHGASHAYVADYVARARGGHTGRLISCHLGGSGSLCAIDDGRSMDTSFGFSLQTGVMHANRVGDMDCFIIPYMISTGMTLDDVTAALGKNGGLLGVSGISNDLRDLEAEMSSGNDRAKLAIDVYCHDIVKYIGAFTAELGGLDCIAFTGGVGENSELVRGRVCRAVEHFGVRIDDALNASRPVDTVISRADSPVAVYVVAANEEIVVARKTYDYR